MSEIRLETINKYFDGNHVLKDVNLTIEDKDFMTLLGPSGCGKTTTLRVISGLENPEGGKMTIDGKVIINGEESHYVPSSKRGMNLVFQNYALWPHLTVFRNVAFGLEIQKEPKDVIQQRVTDALEKMQISEFADRYPSEISGGQQQRVAIARAIVTQPNILLLDEPLSNLDARLRVDMRAELKRLHKDLGTTIIYVTHDQVEALTLSTKIAVFFEGDIVQVDTPQELYDHPNDIRVANFIGNPKINFVDATCDYGDGVGTTHSVLGDFAFPMQGPASQEVVIAIKPEDIRIHQKAAEGMIECLVRSVLPAGSETLIQLTKGDIELMVKVIGTLNLEMDDTVWIEFSPEKVNIYDKSSGKRISR